MADLSEQPDVGSLGATSGGRLADLFLAHRGNVSDKWAQYLAIYEAELASFVARGKPVRLLEIGVQNGGSLQIWRSYLPPGSTIVGVDIDPACAKLELDDGITVLIGDAGDPASLERLLGNAAFDIIVDDGSHRSEHIIAAFESCWKRVAPGGLFVAEDLHSSYFASHGGGFRKADAAIEHFKALADAVNADHFEGDAAQHTDPAERDRLRGLGRQIARVTFYDSVAVVQRVAETCGAPYRRVITGMDRPVLDLAEAFGTHVSAQQLSNLMLSPGAAQAFEPPLRGMLATERQRNDELRAARDAQDAELQALRRTLAAQRDAAEEQHAALREAQGLNAALLESTSWRVTAPLRLLMRAARAPVATINLILAMTRTVGTLMARDGVGFTVRRFFRLVTQRGFRGTVAFALNAIAPSAALAPIRQSEESAFNEQGALLAVEPPRFDRPLALPLGYTPAALPARRVAIIVHIFYADLAPEIVGYLNNIPGAADVFASTDTDEKRDAILVAFSGWKAGTVEVRVLPNRGRDIAPKLVGFCDVYERYEYVLHLHSKKSNHAEHLSAWREYLFRTLLGSSEVVAGVFEAFDLDRRLGMIAPSHWSPIRPLLNWGYDYGAARAIAERMQFDLARDQPLHFPSGSMFWARTAALRPLLELGLTLDDFPEEVGQVDGTLAHAIERLFFRVCEQSGYTWRTIVRPELAAEGDHPVRVSSPLELEAWLRAPLMLGDPALRGTVAAEVRRTNPAFAPLRFMPDTDERPRLTLLIPSYHRSAVFGGIATAVELFQRIARAAGDIETRVVVTSDERRLTSDDVLPGYELVPSDTPAKLPRASFMLCPPRLRPEAGITIRRNDVLLASAWWDAAAAFTLREQQRAFFGHAPKLGYFVQDYEPSFNAWSTTWALAEATYRHPDDTLAMINSETLARYLETMGYRFPGCEVFQPIFNSALSPPPAMDADDLARRKVVLVYWRPSVHRNLCEQALAGLARWLEADPIGTRDWEIWGVGEAGPDVLICPGHKLRNLGKLTMQDYDRVLRTAQIGLSLMLSPHPSYPPLEMAAYGMVVVTNRYGTKDLSLYGSGFECTNGVAGAQIGVALARAAARWSHPEGPGVGLDIARAFASDAELNAMASRVATKLFASG